MGNKIPHTTVMEFTVRGKSAKSIETLRYLTDKNQPVDVVIAALRVYEWVLAQQTKGGMVVAEFHDHIRRPLANYVKRKEKANNFFKDSGL